MTASSRPAVSRLPFSSTLVAMLLLGLVSIPRAHAENAQESTGPDQPIPQQIQEVLDFAQSQIGQVDYATQSEDGPQGWRYIQSLFGDMTGLRLNPSDLETTWIPKGKSWCAIWAFWVYREVHDLDLAWDLRAGSPTGEYRIFPAWAYTSKKYRSLVRPGDIFGIPNRNHHGIVESIKPDGSMITLEANLDYGRIERVTKRRLSDIVTFYRPLP